MHCEGCFVVVLIRGQGAIACHAWPTFELRLFIARVRVAGQGGLSMVSVVVWRRELCSAPMFACAVGSCLSGQGVVLKMARTPPPAPFHALNLKLAGAGRGVDASGQSAAVVSSRTNCQFHWAPIIRSDNTLLIAPPGPYPIPHWERAATTAAAPSEGQRRQRRYLRWSHRRPPHTRR